MWLLWPVTASLRERYSFSRVVLGILLFILFTGKKLYDVLLDKRKEKSPVSDFISMIAVVLIVVLIVAAVVAFVGLFVYLYLGSFSDQSS